MRRNALCAALMAILAAPTLVSAQVGGPGFFFHGPRVTVGVRAGYSLPRAGGDLFDYTLDEFIPSGADTSSSLSFDSPYLGVQVAVRPWQRWDVAADFGWSRSRTVSEYRRWVDNASNPIEQETTFQVISGTLGAKYYFQDRGRQVGSLAWIPSRVNPFVGSGIGVAQYRFRQVGDFVDENTLDVYSDYLETEDNGFIWYGSAGVDFIFARSAVVTAEARYSFSSAGVDGSYVGFRNMDLAGLQLLVGLGFQF